MSIDEGAAVRAVLGELRRLGAALPALPFPYPLAAPTFGPPALEAEIGALEAAAGGALPPDYRSFLQACGWLTAMDVHNGYEFLREPVIRRILLDQVEVPRRILRVPGAVPVVPIAGDGGGNLFLLALHPPGTVWKWSLETGRATHRTLPETSVALRVIAGTFSGFLHRMADDWRHFVEGDQDWDYLAG